MGQIGEFDLIERYFAPLKCRNIPVSVGDDAAVLPARGSPFICTDTLVSGTHFLPDWPLDRVAYKAVAVNVSDLMAMGARAESVQLSLTLPEADERVLSLLADGFGRACDAFGVCLSGGDTTRGALMVLSVTAIGQGVSAYPWLRSGAKAGDTLVVTGTLGDAALGLRMLMGEMPADSLCIEAQQQPTPPLASWEGLVSLDVHAAIDISDGLVQDAWHMARQSRVRLVIEAEKLPLSEAVDAWCRQHNSWDLPLYGGEDYQLLLAMPAKDAEMAAKAGWGTPVGRVEAGEGVEVLMRGRPVPPPSSIGFQHF